MKTFADDKSSDGKIVNLPICQGRKYCGKRRKYWLPAFLLLYTMFSEAFHTAVNSRDLLVKSKIVPKNRMQVSLSIVCMLF